MRNNILIGIISVTFWSLLAFPSLVSAQATPNFCMSSPDDNNDINSYIEQVAATSTANYFTNLRLQPLPYQTHVVNAIKADSRTFFSQRSAYITDFPARLGEFQNMGRAWWRTRLLTLVIPPFLPGNPNIGLTPDAADAITTNFASLLSQVCSSPNFFGNFSFPIPGISSNIDVLASSGSPILTYMNAAIRLLIALIVGIAVLSLVAAGYMYMTAGADGGRVGTAKTLATSALIGIVLSLTAWILLNTISPQFASQLEEPRLSVPPAAP